MKIGQAVSEKALKDCAILYTYITLGQMQITQGAGGLGGGGGGGGGDKIITVTKSLLR